ncbi:DUF4282 domain-containing protein [bacterium]|nr:DUF4282 domain-containing protein [bacterium]
MYGDSFFNKLLLFLVGPSWQSVLNGQILYALLLLPWSAIILAFVAWCGYRIAKGNFTPFLTKAISIIGLWILIAPFESGRVGHGNFSGGVILNSVFTVGIGIYLFTQYGHIIYEKYGHIFSAIAPQTGSNPDGGTAENVKSLGTFLSFHKMVSTSIIKLLYILGLLALTIGGGVGIFSGDEGSIIGLLALTIGNLLWRLICEGWILLFSIHENLASIEGQVKNRQ